MPILYEDIFYKQLIGVIIFPGIEHMLDIIKKAGEPGFLTEVAEEETLYFF